MSELHHAAQQTYRRLVFAQSLPLLRDQLRAFAEGDVPEVAARVTAYAEVDVGSGDAHGLALILDHANLFVSC